MSHARSHSSLADRLGNARLVLHGSHARHRKRFSPEERLDGAGFCTLLTDDLRCTDGSQLSKGFVESADDRLVFDCGRLRLLQLRLVHTGEQRAFSERVRHDEYTFVLIGCVLVAVENVHGAARHSRTDYHLLPCHALLLRRHRSAHSNIDAAFVFVDCLALRSSAPGNSSRSSGSPAQILPIVHSRLRFGACFSHLRTYRYRSLDFGSNRLMTGAITAQTMQKLLSEYALTKMRSEKKKQKGKSVARVILFSLVSA